MDPRVIEHLPPPAPLGMVPQDLRRRPANPETFTKESASTLWRAALFLPAFCGTALLMRGLHDWLAQNGMSGSEWVLLGLIGATFVWVTLSVSTVLVALAGIATRTPSAAHAPSAPLKVALLVPIYNETPSAVFGNAAAILADLARRKPTHRFSLFILSDTRDMAIAAAEAQAFEMLREEAPAGIDVFYRRRAENTDKKVGNLSDWVTRWGAAHEAMVVLDADSLMTGRAICALSDALAQDPSAGLIQSFPALIEADTLFARLQQFSNFAYGWLLAEGLATWARNEGNYWGHNAIIRTRAFAAAAGLPHLRDRKGRAHLILSHDFVEAGLLRRAGWRVRFLSGMGGSFEETPATLIDHLQRDQRWCRGNLQHLRLLGTAGLHPVSRFHLFHGAVSYLLSPAWFCLLVFWTLLGKDADTNVIRYFNEANPLFPNWPPEMSHIDSALFLAIMYAMLLAPKLVAASLIAASGKAARGYGGRRAFGLATGVEIVFSVLYAPILMIQQSKAVLRAGLGAEQPWAPQSRHAQRYSFWTLLRFHWLETALGVVLLCGLASGLVSPWLSPIALSLCLAVPLSALSAVPVSRCLPVFCRMENPGSLRAPAVVHRARDARSRMQRHLAEAS